MKNKANIGCGLDYDKENYIGVDISDFGQEHIMDITQDPLPFEDGSLKEIQCFNTLEHIASEHELYIFNEFNRVLEKGGICHIIVPKFGVSTAIADPTHLNIKWHRDKFIDYYAGKKPRNATYYDTKGRKMAKWAIANDGKGNYLMIDADKHIDIKLQKS